MARHILESRRRSNLWGDEYFIPCNYHNGTKHSANVDEGVLLTTLSASIGLLAIGVLAYTCSHFAVSSLQKKSFLFLAVIFTSYFFISPVYLFTWQAEWTPPCHFFAMLYLYSPLWDGLPGKNYTLFLVFSILAGYLTFSRARIISFTCLRCLY